MLLLRNRVDTLPSRHKLSVGEAGKDVSSLNAENSSQALGSGKDSSDAATIGIGSTVGLARFLLRLEDDMPVRLRDVGATNSASVTNLDEDRVEQC